MHAGVHVVVTLHLGRRTVRTVVVFLGFERHRAGRQREIEPDSRKQPDGAAATGLLLSAAGGMTQLIDSNRVSGNRLITPAAKVKDRRHAFRRYRRC